MSAVRVVVVTADADRVAGELWLHGPVAVSETPAGPDTVELLAGFPDAATAAMVASLLHEVGAEVVADPEDAWWLDTWRETAASWWADDVLVVPAWVEPGEAEGAHAVVRLDAGRAFGSGSHPSTRLAMTLLRRHLGSASSVLDAGSGSGVLAVAAGLLGARRVVATDVDPEALRATSANAARNGVDVEVVDGGIEALPPERHGLVLANIGAGVLRAMATELGERVLLDGTVVLSGLLAHQVEEVLTAYAGFVVAERLDDDGWSAVAIRRRGRSDRPPG